MEVCTRRRDRYNWVASFECLEYCWRRYLCWHLDFRACWASGREGIIVQVDVVSGLVFSEECLIARIWLTSRDPGALLSRSRSLNFCSVQKAVLTPRKEFTLAIVLWPLLCEEGQCEVGREQRRFVELQSSLKSRRRGDGVDVRASFRKGYLTCWRQYPYQPILFRGVEERELLQDSSSARICTKSGSYRRQRTAELSLAKLIRHFIGRRLTVRSVRKMLWINRLHRPLKEEMEERKNDFQVLRPLLPDVPEIQILELLSRKRSTRTTVRL